MDSPGSKLATATLILITLLQEDRESARDRHHFHSTALREREAENTAAFRRRTGRPREVIASIWCRRIFSQSRMFKPLNLQEFSRDPQQPRAATTINFDGSTIPEEFPISEELHH
jgi:hypothetical protein